MSQWRVERLRADHCELLAPHVSEADRLDLLASGYDPEAALSAALLEPGEAWAALLDDAEGKHVLGAFGWTAAGMIWSMWRPLTVGERRDLLKAAPQFVAALVKDAGGRRLGNVVYEGNADTIAWLHASGCFTFLDTRLTYNDRVYLPFVTSPQMGDLASV